MINKVPLHWQIFMALVLAVVFGVIFSSSYILTEKKLTKLAKEIRDENIICRLNILKNKKYKTLSEFEKQLENRLSKPDLKSFQGLIIKAAYHNPALSWIEWMGIVFLRALKMIVIPLIFTSIISGIITIGSGQNLGRLGLKTLLYYVSTSVLAILSGLFFVNVFQPGTGADIKGLETMSDFSIQQKNLKDILIEIVPDNIFKSLVNNDLLSVIFLSLLVGIFITQLDKKNNGMLSGLFSSLFELFMKITMFIIRLAPLGIFGLVAKVIADQDNIGNLVHNLGSFIFCVTSALFIHALLTLPLLTYLFGRNNPLRHLNNMTSALLTAFSTASSAATLPLTMNNVKEKSGVSEKIANFTLPIGATVNMDGTAIYITAVVMFIAQITGMEMGVKEQLIILLTALLASIGTAAIPMASLVIITIILNIFGLPFEMIAIILPVDRILDMFRTTVNVWSDSCGAVIIAKSEGEQLKV
ncbi:MAG: dicarboxylate/amino acid:cation symporter [Bacteroidales bacterium]|nr:dicarboxylate/amino acid:cation symporter [Bacteroidales bacterium]